MMMIMKATTTLTMIDDDDDSCDVIVNRYVYFSTGQYVDHDITLAAHQDISCQGMHAMT